MKQERRIPTLVALLVLLITLGGFIGYFEMRPSLFSKATSTIQISNLHISNVTDSSVAISWISSAPANGSVVYGEGKDRRIAQDDRDREGKTSTYRTHHVSVRNLAPSTTYTFRILSGSQTLDDNGKPYEFTTGEHLGTPPTIEPSYGKIINARNDPAQGALVYLTLSGGQPLSTLSSDSGVWLVPTSLARTFDGRAYSAATKESQIEITIYGEDGTQAFAITDIEHDSPTPEITLGKEPYNFRLTARETKNPDQRSVLGEQTEKPIAILAPGQNSALTSTKPLIRGTALPGKIVRIVVESKPQFGEVTVGSDGTWHWAPEKELPPGSHVLTIRTTDAAGKEVLKSQRFSVLKSGTQVLGEATPSGTITPIVPSATPTLTPMVTPSVTISAISPSPTAIVPSGSMPRSGSVGATIMLLAAGSILFLLGAAKMLVVR